MSDLDALSRASPCRDQAGGRAEPLPKEGKIAGSTAQVKVVAGKKP